jgi:hypothetical protein
MIVFIMFRETSTGYDNFMFHELWYYGDVKVIDAVSFPSAISLSSGDNGLLISVYLSHRYFIPGPAETFETPSTTPDNT